MNRIAYGEIPDGSVSNALVLVLPLLKQSDVPVVRAIDSARAPEDISRSLSMHGITHAIINGNVQISIDELRRSLVEGVFTGFDEIVVFSRQPALPVTELDPVTSDAMNLADGLPKEFMNALEGLGAVVILGDGCGLNYATWDWRIAEKLEILGKEDPQG